MIASRTWDEPRCRHLFEALDLPPSTWEEFRSNVQESCIPQDTPGAQLLADGVDALLAHTWYIIPNGTAIQQPQTGSRPGDSGADILFSFVMAKILNRIQSRLLQEDLVPEPVQGNLCLSTSTTWADDAAFLVTADAASLLRKVEATLTILLDTLIEFGMRLSSGPHKTAVLLEFAGKGSTAHRRQAESTRGHVFRIFSEHQGVISIPMINHYRHLGGILTRGGSRIQESQELRTKSAAALAKVGPLRRVINHPQFPVAHRQLVLHSCGLSILTLHAGTWSGFNRGEYQHWQAAVVKLYACMHARTADGEVQKLPIAQLAHDAAGPLPMELLYLSRLQLLLQLLRHNDLCIRSVIFQNWQVCQEASWLAGVQHSVTWWKDQIGHDRLPVELDALHCEQSWDALQPIALSLKARLVEARQVHLMHLQAHSELRRASHAQQTALCDLGWKCPDLEAPSSDATWHCDQCSAAFGSSTALAVHKRIKHAHFAAARRFAVDSSCRVCRKHFHTRPRLIQHWHSSDTNCWITVFRRYVPMSVEQTQMLDQQDRDVGHALHQHREESVGDVTQDEERQWLLLGALPTCYVGKDSCAPLDVDPKVPHALRDLQSLEITLCSQVPEWTVPVIDVPRPLATNRRFILLLFSGHRRPHDIANWVAWKTDLQPLCVDTAIDRDAGNIFHSHQWINLVRSRTVVAAHAAPPCETYSDARWNPASGDSVSSAPRPLRSSAYPWGMPGRSRKEVRQCLYGTILMLRALSILALVYACGGCFSLEHPRGSAEGGVKWSIWHSAMVKLFVRAPSINTVTFLQGPLGRPYSKPTTFLCARMSSFASAVYAAYQPGWRPSQVLTGRTMGGWATTQAKEYPSKLCEIIADQFSAFASSARMDGHEDVPTELHRIIDILGAPWDPYELDPQRTMMMADFQPGLLSG
eukprot:Skav230284  [mRNA]  locus=scaffold2091:267127:269969:- [translate_table: standard]